VTGHFGARSAVKSEQKILIIVVDSHPDLSWNALNWNRDLRSTVEDIRRADAGMLEAHRGANTVSFPEMRRGEVAICLATVLARSAACSEAYLDYRSPEIASAMARADRQLDG
jgi:membrane dipeptidase